jgi:nicotinamidase-related amidase
MKDCGEWRHLCVDMQRMFHEDTPWKVAWMERISEQVIEVASHHPDRNIFTRFVPPRRPADVPGKWQDYYRKWESMTLEHLHPDLLGLIPSLAALVPPGVLFDKRTYSPWMGGGLHSRLAQDKVGTLAISGAETDVCVLATTLGAIDLGYRVIILEDAVCSGADETYDASLKLLGDRFSVQLELMNVESFLSRS